MTSKVTIGANQQCTIQSSGRITVDTPEVENIAIELSAGSTLVNRGTITATSVQNSGGTIFPATAFKISGTGSKLINYGNIYLPKNNSRAIDVLNTADNVQIEFLSGSLFATDADGGYRFVLSEGQNTKFTFGGTAEIAVKTSSFYTDTSGGGDTVILLPGATIHTGDRSRPFSSVTSSLDGIFAPDGADVLKIGNFYEGDEPVRGRTGWVHAGQWYFGDPTGGTDELIVDTNPGVRFSNHGGLNHYRSEFTDQNAIYGLDKMHIRNGNVVLGGSVYMPMGKVYIDWTGRLTFEIGKRRDPDAMGNRMGEMIMSRLVAKELIFTGNDPKVFIQFAHYLTANDIAELRKQLNGYSLSQLDAANADGAGNELSKILKVDKVLYLAYFQELRGEDPVDITDYVSQLNVMSNGPSGTRRAGKIIVKSDNNADIGKFVPYDASDIGQLRFPSVGTGSTVTGGTGTGGGGTGDDDGTADGGGTGDGGTGDDDGTADGGGTGDGDGSTGDGDSTGDPDSDGTGTSSTGTGGGGGSGGGILVVGLLAALMSGLDLDESESELGQYYAFDRKPAKNRSRNSSYFSGLFRSERGMWVRPAQSRFTSFGASYFGAVSHRMSWDLQQSGDYFLRASLSPATSVSPAGWHSSASGETLSLTGGWHRDDRRLQFGITHGRYDANAKFFDSATQGNLFGESKFHCTSVHASAVQELSDGPMKISASASLMAGQVEQAAYAAENAVMRAKIPAYRQSYTGTRLGFSAKSRKWLALSDAVSVKPHLKITSMRTRSSVNDPVWLRQSDKVGALTFENPTVLQGVPKSLNVVGIGTDVKPSNSSGVWRLGYAGMEVDGEYQHAAVAAYRMRF